MKAISQAQSDIRERLITKKSDIYDEYYTNSKFSNKYFSWCLTSFPKDNAILFSSANAQCIYAIINRNNQRVYIGKSGEFLQRIQRHYRMLLRDKHFNHELQRDFNKGCEFMARPILNFGICRYEQCVIHDCIDIGIDVYNVSISKGGETY